MKKFLSFSLSLIAFFLLPAPSFAKTQKLDNFFARPPIHVRNFEQSPSGLTPSKIKSIYNLPQSGGSGTIAIIDAFDSPNIEKDLTIFDKQFGLSECTKKNKCLTIHKMTSKTDSGWSQETALDVEWAHAVAPNAKILLVETASSNGSDLLKGVDYARKQNGVVSVSMSWGGAEFADADKLASHFLSNSGAAFFASSGDNGTGVQWPAVSTNVIAVGGTTLHFNQSGTFTSESAWSGSGGGVSSFVKEPAFQNAFHILKNNGMRAVPDVSYNADPSSGFSVYRGGWMVVGGTSAGAPQWAAMRALGKNISLAKLYNDAAGEDYRKYFRDILHGTNGDCGSVCKARKNYDFVTGLGSPLTTLY